ncbi:MAG: sigma-54 interaction domain-containing protein [Solirubrobacterales bacterium]
MNDIFNKININKNKKISIDDNFKIIIESFHLIKPKERDLLLINSEGFVVHETNSKLYEYIQNPKLDEMMLGIKEFGGVNGCPVFYIIHIKEDYNLDIEDIGEKINKNYTMVNLYKEKYDMLINYLDAIQEGISAVDRDGTLVYVNSACSDMLETSKSQLLNRNAGDISKSTPRLLQVIKSKQAVIDKEYFMEFKNKNLHLTSSAYPVYDNLGNIAGAIDIFRSISRSRKLANLMAGQEAVFSFENIEGSSKMIAETIGKAKKMSLSKETILIEGASGCGKELFAQAIHNYSERKGEAFIAVNCANLPNELVESELFGYEEGAFTGAVKGGKPGKFELANGGTLFLDEIGEMPMHIQTKLLRAVEYKYINRVGGNRTFNVDVRIIAATNRNLEELVREGKFRGDLFYRLKVLYLRIPSLMERGNDVIELAEYFIRKFSNKMNKEGLMLDNSAKEILIKYQWPGNVRELENCMARVVFLCEGKYISKDNIIEAGISVINDIDGEGLNNYRLYGLSPKKVREVYENTNKNKKKSAEILGVSRPTIYKLLELYGIK